MRAVERKKDYANPLAIAEQGVAAHLAGVPEIAQGRVPVFALTDEGATENIRRAISQNLGQVVTVGLSDLDNVVHVSFDHASESSTTTDDDADATESDESSTDEPARTDFSTVADATFQISVISPGLMASRKISGTTDLGYAVLRALDGALFERPLLTSLCFAGWTQSEADGVFTATLSFTAKLGLLFIDR